MPSRNYTTANARRTADAGARNAQLARQALGLLDPSEHPHTWGIVLRARADMPQASWSEISDKLRADGEAGMTRYVCASVFRRALTAAGLLDNPAEREQEARPDD